MNEDTDQIIETFAAHEYLAPDAAEVLKNAKGRARAYHRRRVATRATGGAVMGAGLVAGGITLPGWAPHSLRDDAGGVATAGGSLSLPGSAAPSSPASSSPASSSPGPSSPATSSPVQSTPPYTQAQELAEYFAAGYDYNNALQLAQLWNDGTDITTVKAAAGLKLLEGQALPVQPNGTPESPADQDRAAFFAAGYGYDDAVILGKMWGETDWFQVKADAGQKLLAGQTLPIKPTGSASAGESPDPTVASGSADAGAQADPGLAAYFAAGYTYDDAVALGNLWHETDIAQIKSDAGQKLIAGQTLPIGPSGTPESQADQARAAFFAAGYTYDDAVTLGNLWHETDTYQVKADAGQKLLAGQTLPINP
jgi:hypothetical protein